MFRVFLALGSNLGDRSAHLNAAAGAIGRIPGTVVVVVSPVYETQPFGRTDQGPFLNAAMEIATPLPPRELLAAVQEAEQTVGRTPAERWGPREIDIDILLYDGLVVQEPDLQVPHPGLPERRFVLIPLRDIAEDVVHPVSGLTVAEMASACPDTTRVVRSAYHIRI